MIEKDLTPQSSTHAIDPAQIHQVSEFKYDFPLTTLRVDPTGSFVAAGAQDLDVQLWNLKDGGQKTLKAHKSWVRSIDFSRDGKRLYTACWGGIVKIWNLTQKEPEVIHSIQAHKGATRWVRVSPDGKLLATCGNDLLVKLWNAEDGKKFQEFKGHQRHVYAVDFHPEGNHLVSQDLVGKIFFWDLKSKSESNSIVANMMTGYDKKFAADMGGARDMSFNKEGTQWVSAGITKVSNAFAGIQDPNIVLFDWESGKAIQQFRASDKFKGVAWGARFHPGGFIIGAGADRSGKGEIWFFDQQNRNPDSQNKQESKEKANADTSKPYHTLKTKSAARGLDLIDENRIAVAHADGFVRLYSLTRKEEPVSEVKDDK